MTMWENFSQNLQQILIAAQVESSKLGVDYIGSEHLILGILKHRHNTACRELRTLGVDLKELQDKILDKIHKSGKKGPVNFSFSARATRIVEIAYALAQSLDQEIIGSEHILMGLLREGHGIPAKILINEFDITYKMILKELYGIEELKPVNFMESRKFVENELKLLEENFHKSSLQKQLLDGKVEEMVHLMDYLGDMFASINRKDLKREIEAFKSKCLSSLLYKESNTGIDGTESASPGHDTKKGSDQNTETKEKNNGEIDRIDVNMDSAAVQENTASINGGVSITINVDGSMLRKMIKEAVGELIVENREKQ